MEQFTSQADIEGDKELSDSHHKESRLLADTQNYPSFRSHHLESGCPVLRVLCEGASQMQIAQ